MITASQSPSKEVNTSNQVGTTNDTTTIAMKLETERNVTDVAARIAGQVARDTTTNQLPRYVEVLGVFVALFTFVSVQIQIFSKITLLSNAVLFSFFIFICMTAFLFMLHLIIGQNTSDKHSIGGLVISMICLVLILAAGFATVLLLMRNDTLLDRQGPEEISKINVRLEVLERLLQKI